MKDYEQFLFPFVGPDAIKPHSPPATRDECDHIQRPCNRTTCRHNLMAETERAGKPHNGKHPDHRLRVLQPGAESCALDVAGRGEHSNEQVGAHLGISGARARQIAVRGGVKLLALTVIENKMDEAREELARHGVVLDLTYPDGSDTAAVSFVGVMRVPKMGPAPGVTVRPKVGR